MLSTNQRPPYVSKHWLRHFHGFAFIGDPPLDLLDDRYLDSSNLWERVVCITLQAQHGDFRNVDLLLDVVDSTMDVHFGLSALRVFVHAAPSPLLPKISSTFNHLDYDIRIESLTAPALTCDLSVVEPLIDLIPQRSGEEREYLSGTLWDLLDSQRDEESELIHLDQDADAQVALARQLKQKFIDQYSQQTAILWGAPLDLSQLITQVRRMCAHVEHNDLGGDIHELISIFEAMTGMSCIGCFTKDCAPIRTEISKVLNCFEQSGRTSEFKLGQRYFFGHPIPH